MAVNTDKQLAWEARHRLRAAIAALLAALGVAAYYVLSSLVERDAPTISFLASLGRAGAPGDVGDLPSMQIPFFEYLDSKMALVLGTGIGGFVGFVGLAWAVGFLAMATRAREPALRRFMAYLPIVGGVLLGLGILMRQIAVATATDRFLGSSRTVEAAAGTDGTLVLWAKVLLELGSLMVAIGLILVALNAMRAGLLTRLMGYLGIVAGAMLILFPLPVVQIFWLGGLAVLFARLWPGGDPPAWRTGQAEPWPTRVVAPAQPAAAPAASSSPRRKRKKRH